MRSGRRRRDGYVMVLVAMLLFGLFAMAALVIDLGFARLTQRQMQTAADAAALEGLRFVDTDGRQLASSIASWHFDDDLGSTNVDHVFGAGPVVNFSGGAGDTSQTLDTSTPYYRPNLQQNAGDDIAGDMLQGNYAFEPVLGSSPAARKEFHQEMPDYSRGDFPAPDPGGVLGLVTHPAFLVRLRRTDEAPVDSIRTSGPPLPFLFGRGSLISRESIGNGIQARATSIAALEPVITVGSAVGGRIGSHDIAVSIADWNDLDADTFFVYESNIIGEVIGAPTNLNNLSAGYVAIYDPLKGDRVIGFGMVDSISSGTVIKTPSSLSSSVQVASDNASAVPCIPLTVTGNDAIEVFESRRANRAILAHAPVSAR